MHMYSPHKGQWREALMYSLICAWINDWVNNREAGDLRRYGVHYDVIVMLWDILYKTASVSVYQAYIQNNRISSLCHDMETCLAFLTLSQVARFMGPTWGPPGADTTQVGPMWATWTLLSGFLVNEPVTVGFLFYRQEHGLLIYFAVEPNKLVNKHSSNRWRETTWRSCDISLMYTRWLYYSFAWGLVYSFRFQYSI